MSEIKIELLKEVKESDEESLQTLFDQLLAEPISVQRNKIKAALTHPTTNIFVARKANTIVGFAMLGTAEVINKKKGFVENVVVDASQRGKGVGVQLMEALHTFAKENNVDELYLTSHPRREAAHKLYKKLGYIEKDTSVFKKML